MFTKTELTKLHSFAFGNEESILSIGELNS